MKKMKLSCSLLMIVGIFLALTSCNNTQNQNNNSTEEKIDESTIIDKTGPEYTSAYICPMYCEGSGSDSLGVCPVCKMDYIPNKNLHQDGDHGHDHHGHDHDHNHNHQH